MNFHRYYVPNAIIFITQVVQDRVPVLRDETHFELLRSTLRQVKELHPFSMLGYVFLHDHFHMLIKPTGNSTYSQIMHSLKPNFTKAYKQAIGISGPIKFWQKRFWEHTIRDEADFARHLDYIHYNPVKHGLAAKPENWARSSFSTWKERGAYADGWGWAEPSSVVGFDWSGVE